MKKIILLAGAILLVTLIGLSAAENHGLKSATAEAPRRSAVSASIDEPAGRVVKAAREQVGQTICYDLGYRKLHYPNGDVPTDRGVCTDVLIRALRRALGMDLQKLVHEGHEKEFLSIPEEMGP
jgi:uncharacterized protein